MNRTAAERFVGRLQRLGIAERGALKAAAGRPLQPDVAVFDAFTAAFWPARAALPRDACLLVATLHPWHPTSGGQGDLGESLRKSAAHRDRFARVERLFEELLATSFRGLDDPLFRTVQVVAAAGVPVDWAALVVDLGRWDRPARLQELSVQDAWANSWLQYGSDHAD